ncbi:MAG: hypothetical protein ACLUFI_15235 [Oscillospiraceae bacterium]
MPITTRRKSATPPLTDLIHWEKDPRNPLIKPNEDFMEDQDFRDPNVFWNEKEQCWWMTISCRVKDGPVRRRGALCLCTSTDLENWTAPELFNTPYLTDCPECSEIFQLGEKWYSSIPGSRKWCRRSTSWPTTPEVRGAAR